MGAADPVLRPDPMRETAALRTSTRLLSDVGHSRPMRPQPPEHVCPLFARKRTNGPTWDVRFVPKLDSCTAAKSVFIRLLRQFGQAMSARSSGQALSPFSH